MLTESLTNENSASLLLVYCKDIDEWPHHWAIDHADIPIGCTINEYFKCFLIDRIDKKRAKSTIKIYARYLWALGGELIRRIHDDNNKRRMISKDFILKYIDNSGGPYWHHAKDDFERTRYNSVCKQLLKFIRNDSDTR